MPRLTRREVTAGLCAAIPTTLIDGPRYAVSGTQDLPMIVLAPPGGATHLPLIVKSKGFDTKAGINVQLRPRNELAAYFNDFAAKVEPVHQGGAASIFGNMRARGVPIVLTHSTCVLQILLVVPANSPIRSTTDLKGRRFAIDRGGFHYGWMRVVARQAGLDLERDVTIVPASLPASAPLLLRGDVDAAALPTGFFDAAAARNPGKLKALYAIDDEVARSIGIKQIYTLAAAHEDFAKQNPDLLRKMFSIWTEAANWANANMTEAIELLARPVPDGGAGLPKPVLEAQLVTNKTLRWEIAKASDLKPDLFKEFQAYVDTGTLAKLPDDGIIWTGL
jgi:NitT/TauT family transport system substrate-binding protein